MEVDPLHALHGGVLYAEGDRPILAVEGGIKISAVHRNIQRVLLHLAAVTLEKQQCCIRVQLYGEGVPPAERGF